MVAGHWKSHRPAFAPSDKVGPSILPRFAERSWRSVRHIHERRSEAGEGADVSTRRDVKSGGEIPTLNPPRTRLLPPKLHKTGTVTGIFSVHPAAARSSMLSGQLNFLSARTPILPVGAG